MGKVTNFCAIFLCLPLLVSCSNNDVTTLEKIKSTGTIRVGFANDVPYGYMTEHGELTGEAIEVARRVLSEIGVHKIEGIFVEFGSLIDGLNAGRFDMIAAGMFVLPSRCKEIAFSEPTYRVGQAFAVKSGNPKKLHSYRDVANNPNAVLCVMEGAVEGSYAIDSGIPKARIISVSDTTTGLNAVVSGEADALALTSLSIQNLIQTSENLGVERASPFMNPVINKKEVLGHGAFGFRKEDNALLREFNRHLIPFIGTQEHLALVAPFGFTEFPKDITTEELCRH